MAVSKKDRKQNDHENEKIGVGIIGTGM